MTKPKDITTVLWTTAFLCVLCLHPSLASYMDYPHINFAGQFRADSNTHNNNPCHYDVNHPLETNLNTDWGFNGTNEFSFFDVKVMSVVYTSGDNSMSDPVIGQSIVDNLKRPFSKLIDIDVDYKTKSTIYGMKFGMSWGEDQNGAENLAFYGKWTRAVVAQDMWARLHCYSRDNHGPDLYQPNFPFSSQSTTFLTDVEWGNLGGSQALQELKAAFHSQGPQSSLSIRITLFYYTLNYPPYVALNATLGYVVGTIGVAHADDTLNFGGQRLLSPTTNTPIDLTFIPGDLCYNQDVVDYIPWLSKAPFEVDETRLEVVVDLSNALPLNLYSTLRDIGILQLGILQKPTSGTCVYLLGSDGIPYLSDGWLSNTGGIYVYQLDKHQANMLADSELVVIQVVSGGGGLAICGVLSSIQGTHTAQILLQEDPYFVRPWDYYLDRLEYQDTSPQTLYVTYFGKPAAHISVMVYQSNPDVLPLAAVVPDQSTKLTNSEGKVTFIFTANVKIPFPRRYTKLQCSNPPTLTLPIDGQVYQFKYCVVDACSPQTSISEITFLAFSAVDYTFPYYWDTDVKPILTQYAHLNNVMKTILDLGDYWDVIHPSNIHLLNHFMSVDFESPAYMPISRDLSPTKRQMILQWLKNPVYSSDSPSPSKHLSTRVAVFPDAAQARRSYTSYSSPPRCTAKSISFKANPMDADTYFRDILDPNKQLQAMQKSNVRPVRPLFGINVDQKIQLFEYGHWGQCSLDNLKLQLQQAVQLEFYTIPLYLTALYSIVDGCNREVYTLISSVVKQEMQHMTQAANILIAVGGNPLIDSPTIAPKYPAVGLPGGVLPSLHVSLKRLSLVHVYNTFMGVEVPMQTLVGGAIFHLFTIGQFYNEITHCIKILGDNIFDDPGRAKLQVEWPWDAPNIGNVTGVVDKDAALKAIDNIVAQGEGTGPLDPTEIANDKLAHFFKFEEIVCQHRLVEVDTHHYSYVGVPIPFDPLGVWPMRDNPSADGIKPNTNCYTEAKNFHHAYRALLQRLQETFGGHPEYITATVEIMETLQVHAKKLMWTLFQPNSTETCGPLWDYEWED